MISSSERKECLRIGISCLVTILLMVAIFVINNWQYHTYPLELSYSIWLPSYSKFEKARKLILGDIAVLVELAEFQKRYELSPNLQVILSTEEGTVYYLAQDDSAKLYIAKYNFPLWFNDLSDRALVNAEMDLRNKKILLKYQQISEVTLRALLIFVLVLVAILIGLGLNHCIGQFWPESKYWHSY